MPQLDSKSKILVSTVMAAKSSSGANLPKEVVDDILSRLPAKSLCRFKCVSKSWRTLISDPHFVETHLNRDNNNKRERLIFISKSLYSIDCTEASNNDTVIATKLDFPSIKHPFDNCDEILGSCNGLLLVGNKLEPKFLFLLNPSTRESKKIPISPFALRSFSSYTRYGLGYDSSTDDYKVVSVAYYGRRDHNHDDDYDDVYCCIDRFISVYSLKTGSWRRIQDIPFDRSTLQPCPLVLVNGSMHWLTYKSSDNLSVIVAFDVANKKFRDLPAPCSLDNNKLVYYKLGAFGGCLYILVCRYTIETDVWVMKEYGVTESWTKFTMPRAPLCFLMDGEVLLEMDGEKLDGENLDGEKLVAFNAKERTSRDIVVRGIPALFKEGKTYVETYVESLVSPYYNNEIGRNWIVLESMIEAYRAEVDQ